MFISGLCLVDNYVFLFKDYNYLRSLKQKRKQLWLIKHQRESRF